MNTPEQHLVVGYSGIVGHNWRTNDGRRVTVPVMTVESRPWRTVNIDDVRAALLSSPLCSPDQWTERSADDLAQLYDDVFTGNWPTLLCRSSWSLAVPDSLTLGLTLNVAQLNDLQDDWNELLLLLVGVATLPPTLLQPHGSLNVALTVIFANVSVSRSGNRQFVRSFVRLFAQ